MLSVKCSIKPMYTRRRIWGDSTCKSDRNHFRGELLISLLLTVSDIVLTCTCSRKLTPLHSLTYNSRVSWLFGGIGLYVHMKFRSAAETRQEVALTLISSPRISYHRVCWENDRARFFIIFYSPGNQPHFHGKRLRNRPDEIECTRCRSYFLGSVYPHHSKPSEWHVGKMVMDRAASSFKYRLYRLA